MRMDGSRRSHHLLQVDCFDIQNLAIVEVGILASLIVEARWQNLGG